MVATWTETIETERGTFTLYYDSNHGWHYPYRVLLIKK